MVNEAKQKPPRRYEKMRDSGVAWIGMVPEGWTSFLLGQLVKQVKNKNVLLQERNLLSLSYGKIKRKDIETAEGLVPASYDGYNIIEKGDIVLRLTDLQNDHTSLRVGLATERGIITSAYLTLRPLNSVFPAFLYYALHTFDVRKGFYGMGAGVRQGLKYDEIRQIKVVLPALIEQHTIANFLDKKCSEIDAIIADAKASIEEYKAWKASIIYEAVTKGLDPHAEMKDSGVEWLEQIPAHVNISRVGLQFDIILGKMLCPEPRTQDDTLGKYYCAANVHFDGVSQIDLKQMWFNPAEKERYLVKQGDLLVVEGGAGAGGCAICSALPKENIYIQNSIMIVRPRRNVDTHYLKYLIEFLVTHGYVDFVCNKATIPHFTKEKLANVPFPMFTCKEQKDIAQYLDGRCRKIDELITEKGNLISDLESYKKALIYEVVTGKRRVC